jgi:hypothetical protein
MHEGGEDEHRRRRVRGNRTARAAQPGRAGESSTDPTAAVGQAGPAARVGPRRGSDSTGTGGRGAAIAAPRRPTGGDRSHDGRRRFDGDETSYTAGAGTSDHVPYDNHLTPVAEDHERGLRGLIGGGSSQVSVTAAMRARDAARPSDADIAEAERSLTIVHRGWVPRDP